MSNPEIKRVQQALKDLGFNPGDVDGIWGRSTIGAVKRFQQKAQLEADGVVGFRHAKRCLASQPYLLRRPTIQGRCLFGSRKRSI